MSCQSHMATSGPSSSVNSKYTFKNSLICLNYTSQVYNCQSKHKYEIKLTYTSITDNEEEEKIDGEEEQSLKEEE